MYTKKQALEDTRAEIAQIEQRHTGSQALWSAGVRQRHEGLERRAARLAQEIRTERLAELGSTTEPKSNRGNYIGGVPVYAGGNDRQSIADEARHLIEYAHRTSMLHDEAAEKAEDLVVSGRPADQASAARWVVATGNPEYLSAFAKLCADPQRGHMLWTGPEQDAYRAVEEFRAMTLSDPSGGYMVPLTLDPAIMLTSAGSVDPMRRISRVVQTVTDTWTGITSAGVTAEWLAESAQAADATPTLQNPVIPVYKGDAFIPYSYEVGMDAVNFVQETGKLLADGADQLQAAAFLAGTGTGQPSGVLTGMPAGSKVATATADVLVSADVYKPQNALPPRFQPNARWLANITTTNQIQAFETAAGSKVFPEVATRDANGDSVLLRKPLHEASGMTTAGTTAAAGNDNVLLYGDFQAGFVIVDRIGTTIEFIPNLFGAAGRPIGQRGMFLWFRTGSQRVVDNAFRLLTA